MVPRRKIKTGGEYTQPPPTYIGGQCPSRARFLRIGILWIPFFPRRPAHLAGTHSAPQPRRFRQLDSGLLMQLAMPLGMTTRLVQAAQLRRHVQAPDRRLSARLIALGQQVGGNSVKHLLGHAGPAEWALRLDHRGLTGGHTGGAEQGPEALLTCQRAHLAFDAGDHSQAVTGQTEAARHGDGSGKDELPAYTRTTPTESPRLPPQAVDNSVDEHWKSASSHDRPGCLQQRSVTDQPPNRSEEHTSELQSQSNL